VQSYSSAAAIESAGRGLLTARDNYGGCSSARLFPRQSSAGKHRRGRLWIVIAQSVGHYSQLHSLYALKENRGPWRSQRAAYGKGEGRCQNFPTPGRAPALILPGVLLAEDPVRYSTEAGSRTEELN